MAISGDGVHLQIKMCYFSHSKNTGKKSTQNTENFTLTLATLLLCLFVKMLNKYTLEYI